MPFSLLRRRNRRPAIQPSRRTRLGLERLEARIMLDATPVPPPTGGGPGTTPAVFDVSGTLALGATGSLNYTFHRETDATGGVTASVLDITGAFGVAETFHLHTAGGNGSFTTTVDEANTALFAGQTPTVTADAAWLTTYLGAIQNAVAAEPAGIAAGTGESVNTITAAPGGLGTTVSQTTGGTTRTFTLDASGQELSDVTTDAATGRVLQSHAYTYDAAGRTLTRTDGNQTTAWTYDAAGHQLTETLSSGTPQAATTQFVWQGDNVVQVIDPDGNATSYGYDAQNRVISVTDALGHTQYQSFDAAGNVASITNRDGLRRDFAYDSSNRETGETWYAADGVTVTNVVAYAYDDQGRLTSAGDDAGTYAFTYDANGRVAAVSGPFGVSLAFGYDANGNRVLVLDSLGGTTVSQYDSANELVGRWFAQDGTPLLGITQQFDDNGNVVGQTRTDGLGNTVVTTAYAYDPTGNLTGFVHARADGSVIANYSYAYDAAGNLASQSDGSGTHTYSYDTSGQLTADNLQTQTYDANGNRANAGYVTGADNRLLSDGTWSYGYDNDGNVVSKTSIATGESWAYGYDAKDRMVSAAHYDATGVLLTQANYAYDVYDHRIVSIVTDTTGVATETHFAYDGDHLFALLDAGNHLVKRYVSLDASDSAFVRIGADGGVAWLLADRLGTIRDIVDNTGAVIDHRDYDAWGNLTNETNPQNGDQLGYAGYFYEAAVGMFLVWHRWYDSSTGRWMQKDPMSFAAGDSNLYRYVGNGATNATDPTGYQSVSVGLPVQIAQNWNNAVALASIIETMKDAGIIVVGAYTIGKIQDRINELNRAGGVRINLPIVPMAPRPIIPPVQLPIIPPTTLELVQAASGLASISLIIAAYFLPQSIGDLAAIQEKIKGLQGILTDVAEDLAAGDITQAAADATKKSIEQEIESLVQQMIKTLMGG